ncbi:MAG: FAD-dependent oxidoreductase [Dysosmobacter sp.]
MRQGRGGGDADGRRRGLRQVVLSTGAVYDVKAAILATGTYLRGRTIIGDVCGGFRP